MPPSGLLGKHTHSIDQQLLRDPAKLLTCEASSIAATLLIKLRPDEIKGLLGALPALEL